MFVQALAAYADTYLSDELADEAFEVKPVPYELQIYEDGTFAGIRERVQEVTKGKKQVQRVEEMKAPKSPVGRTSTSTSYPLPGCDAIPYVLGPNTEVWSKPNALEKEKRHHDTFVKLIRQAADETNDLALRACAAFYDQPDEVAKARQALVEKEPRSGRKNLALTVIRRDPAAQNPGGPVIHRPAVRDWWQKKYKETYDKERVVHGWKAVCLISGKYGPIARTHDKIKGADSVGGQSAGAALMSFDKGNPAFESYGWEQNANSPVSPNRAAAYVLALNDLLKLGAHRRGASRDAVPTRFDVYSKKGGGGKLEGAAFLFWTREPSDDDIHALFNEAQPEQVHALLSAPITGKTAPDADPNEFYLAAVSGNGGRLLVRYWFHDKLANVRSNIRRWFTDLRIADVFREGKPSEPCPLWQLLSSISSAKGSPSEKANKVPPDRAIQLVRRALHGLPLGRTILAAALYRLRVPPGDDRDKRRRERLSPARIGLVRMCVNDIETTERKGEPLMNECLDSGCNHPAYICGRLLAVYDKLQCQAQGDVNVTVVDRYYALASTYPQLAFPKLEALSKVHLKKARRDKPGAAVNIQRELDELFCELPGGFPGQLSLEDQGRFAIGYHHQRAEDARRMAEAKARKAEASQAG